MPRFKSYDYRQSVLLPVNLEDQIQPGTLEFIIHTLVEEQIDMKVFDGKYKDDDTGRKAYDPKVLLKISEGLGDAMKGLEIDTLNVKMAERGK